MRLEVVPCDASDVRLVQVTGELDVVGAPTLLPKVESLVTGAAALVLDLAQVSFFDSAGVRFTDRVARECDRAGTAFQVVAPPGCRARRVLELVGMADELVSDDVSSAITATRPAV